jgi:hypothetical protein
MSTNLSLNIAAAITSQFQLIQDNTALDNYITGGGGLGAVNQVFTNGTGAGKVQNCWHSNRTVLTGNNDDIYLNGNPSFANKFGTTNAFSIIRAIFLRMVAPVATKNLVLGNHPTAPWGWDFGATSNTRNFADLIIQTSINDGWAVGGALAAPLTPVVGASGSGSTIPNGTYYVWTTYINPAGETVASPVSAGTAISGGQNLVVTTPAASGNATQYNVYVSTSPTGARALQGSATALGSNNTLTALVNFGAVPPTFSSAYVNSILRIANSSGSTLVYDIAVWGE